MWFSRFNHQYLQDSASLKLKYRKIPKTSPAAYISQKPFLRGLFLEGLIFGGAYLCMERNLRFKIDWSSLIVGSKFTVYASFYFVFERNFLSTSPRGAYIWRGDLTEGFLRYRFGGLIFGGAYFRNLTVTNFCRLTERALGLFKVKIFEDIQPSEVICFSLFVR